MSVRRSAVVCWFSCGASSAVAAKMALSNPVWGMETIVAYCDTSVNEHPDNLRFLADCERWFGRTVLRLRSKQFPSMRVEDVWRKRRAIKFAHGAPCTTHLKKNVRRAFQVAGDIQVFGLAADEETRVKKFLLRNGGIDIELPLVELGITTADARRRIVAAGIEEPAMYKLGFNHNNCMEIVCPKGGRGYANKMRRDFPESFDRTARIERALDVSIFTADKETRPQLAGLEQGDTRIFLDMLDPNDGRHDPPEDIDCGVGCDLWADRQLTLEGL